MSFYDSLCYEGYRDDLFCCVLRGLFLCFYKLLEYKFHAHSVGLFFGWAYV